MFYKYPFIIEEYGKESIILIPGIYRIECWGAEGGDGVWNGSPMTKGGKGAYVSGILTTHSTLPLYLFVGGNGGNGSPDYSSIAKGGFNGGGFGGADDDDGSRGGGGATDIRLTDGMMTTVSLVE